MIDTTLESSILTLDSVSKSFFSTGGEVSALNDVSLQVKTGEIVALIGPSGCGKSTLLNLIGGLASPSAGEIAIEGQLAFATAFPPNASLFGDWTENGESRRLGPLHVQQAGARYRWGDEQAYGMIDRSWPAGP